ncbi:AAA family ATPase [Cryobacterium sp. TMT2-14]|uniref:AAA family ATPase n=1 Tax=Cryobacterium sp. TMT2-14 TaxID=1259245 RepID=UPI00106DCDAB|nr:AAA family ATPase [Cryobacterium sp. TMT2-14]TFC36867.1 SMC family ATPase [Cryobacterium sp. TMT2-14]
MKIKRLRIAGFGPYKNEQVIDFERFDADGIFLITGKTGAGKSSILDAVCFALYGSVPRYEGTESQLRSDHCEPDDPTFVELEFALHENDYRIYRTPRYEKNKKRGPGTTMSPPDARLDIRDLHDDRDTPEGWRSVATRPVDVGHELSRILPLKQDQFLQVILLAQNRFQRFLLAKTDDRRGVLRTLFGTARFEQLELGLISRRKSLDDGLESVRQRLAGLAATASRHLQREDLPGDDSDDAPGSRDRAWFDAALAELDELLAEASAGAERATSALELAAAGVQAQEDLRSRQDRRNEAHSALAVLEARQVAVALDRAAVLAANRASRVWPALRTRREAEEALERALVGESYAHGAWREYQDDPGLVETTESLKAVIENLLGRLGSLKDVLDVERLLPGIEAKIVTLQEELALHVASVEQTQALLDELPDRMDDVNEALAAAALAAASEPEARAQAERLRAAEGAAGQVRRLDAELEVAHRADAVAAGENAAAAVRYQTLVDRRLAGHAVELASHLVPGEPCEVCGSTAHPAPATGDEEPVTEADIVAARACLKQAQTRLDQTHVAAGTVATDLAEARARAGERTIDEIVAEMAASEVALAAAVNAGVRAAALGLDKSRLRAELDEAGRALAGLCSARDVAAVQLAERRSARQAIDDRVSAQRGDFASVGHRVDRLRAELASARALGEALDHSRERRSLRNAAGASVQAQLDREGFVDEQDVAAAHQNDADVRQLEELIRGHDDSRAAARSVLAEPALTGLPAGLTDVGPARETLVTAAAERDAALAERGSLGERVAVMTGLVTDARVHFDAGAELLSTQTQVRELAAAVHGDEPNTKRMRLETYVLAAQLEQIIAAANNRLRTMTGGRYTLEHDDSVQFRGGQSGLGLMIRDAHTGRARPTQSLSGGETFLASLALALGLAEIVSNQAGGIALDTLFVDEGFGSLDGATLETAMSTLDGLRAGGRTIGLISHVDSMKEQIPAKLVITVSDQGFSEIGEVLVSV